MKAYVIRLSGQGDTHTKLVNSATWDYIINDGVPAPDYQVQKYMETDGIAADKARHWFLSHSGIGKDNDRAMIVDGDEFDGEVYDDYDAGGGGNTADLMAFIQRHNLEIAEEDYGGYIF